MIYQSKTGQYIDFEAIIAVKRGTHGRFAIRLTNGPDIFLESLQAQNDFMEKWQEWVTQENRQRATEGNVYNLLNPKEE